MPLWIQTTKAALSSGSSLFVRKPLVVLSEESDEATLSSASS
jgi:hypothetical protein